MHLILGSTSPRRREILNYFSLDFEQMSPSFDEDALPFLGDPSSYVQALARGKALSLASLYPEGTILSADTIVYKEGKIYGKPKNEIEAFHSLQELQGSWHSVYSGIALWQQGQFYEGVEETKVLFNPLTSIQIESYLKALHWADKAGGYAIQLAGSLIVQKIDGCYYNVMGLPINTVNSLLKHIGIDLWEHLN